MFILPTLLNGEMLNIQKQYIHDRLSLMDLNLLIIDLLFWIAFFILSCKSSPSFHTTCSSSGWYDPICEFFVIFGGAIINPGWLCFCVYTFGALLFWDGFGFVMAGDWICAIDSGFLGAVLF